MFDYVRLSIVAILLASCFQASNKEQGPPIGIQALSRGFDGCAQGMRLMEFESLAKRVCIPSGEAFSMEGEDTEDPNVISLFVYSPRNSSPLFHVAHSGNDPYSGGNWNVLNKKHNEPESDIVIIISVRIDSSLVEDAWVYEEYFVDNVLHGKSFYDLINASPDTLKTIDRITRDQLIRSDYPRMGMVWGAWSRNNVQWMYDLWVRRISHSGQVRAGIEAINVKGDRSVSIVAHWVRDALPETLDELRSDSMFVIATEVVDSFEWPE
jgi:hypothetical protein